MTVLAYSLWAALKLWFEIFWALVPYLEIGRVVDFVDDLLSASPAE